MENTLVIIPTYNEIENIASIIAAVFDTGLAVDVLIVDDQSPDGTAQEVINQMDSYPERLFLETKSKKEGLGAAYVHGFLWALRRQYEYIFEMDADFSHDPKELPSMLQELKNQSDVVVGSRYIHGVNVVNWPLSRVMLSFFASVYVRWITGMPVKDATAGYVGYRRAVLEQLHLDQIRFVGYAFQIEMKYKLWKKNYKLKEYQIIFVNRKFGNSKMDKSIIFEAITGVLKLKFNSKK